MKKILLILISVIFCSGKSFSLEISPENFLLRGAPGEKIERKLILTNDTGETIRVAIEFVPRELNTKSSRSWIKVSKKTVKIKPRMKQIVKLVCKVPSAGGELEGSLLIKNVSEKNGFYEIRYRQPVLLQIKGTEVSRVSISGVEFKQNGQEIVLEASVVNEGNTRITPKLVCEWTNEKGEKINKIFDAGHQPIPPVTQKTFVTKLSNEKGAPISKGTLSLYFHDSEGALKLVQRQFESLGTENKQ